MDQDDQLRFLRACDKIVGVQREKLGIGTLKEKTIHAVLKNYMEPDEQYHEQNIHGFYADICNDQGIIEVQTRGFDRLRKKLAAFLPDYPVTLVYPIPRRKYLCWIDEETGEISKRRKSPKIGKPYEIFPELYKIKQFLPDPNLHLHIVLIDMEEYRLLNGWSRDRKKGSTRYDRIPIGLVEEFTVQTTEEYLEFLPQTLEEPFTTKDYRARVKISQGHAQIGLHILHYVDVVERVGKKGNMYLYERKLK